VTRNLLPTLVAVSTDSAALPLRDRKKRATREALSAAALRLALERGVENVRVEDIAAAAGVSPRTYNNYFSSRAEAICVAEASERAMRMAAALRERPADEPLFEAISTAILQFAGQVKVSKSKLRRLMAAPAVRGEYLKAHAAIERALAEAIAERIGADVDRDLRPQVLASALAGALRAAPAHWRRPGTTVAFTTLLRRALDTLAPAFDAAAARGVETAAC
jgi:AcrR family transcriptional regulator